MTTCLVPRCDREAPDGVLCPEHQAAAFPEDVTALRERQAYKKARYEQKVRERR